MDLKYALELVEELADRTGVDIDDPAFDRIGFAKEHLSEATGPTDFAVAVRKVAGLA